MSATDALKTKVTELSEREWDFETIKARIRKLESEGIPKKTLDPEKVRKDKQQILDRVQRHAEEYNFIAKNCAQGTALALLEEFGLGSMDVIKALMNFPGIGGTGEMCGGVTGSLIAFGLKFGADDILDFQTNGPTMITAQKFMATFEDEVGYLYCSDIQEKVIFGRNMDPGASEKNMEAFAKAQGFEKCGLPPGIGARLAAEFIIESLE
jgi:C_GCAxxG_C_C family probable redox protein